MTAYFISVHLEVIHREGALREESVVRIFKGRGCGICNHESLVKWHSMWLPKRHDLF